MRVIQAAVKHYQDQGLLSAEVPEWVIEGKPVTIYWRPVTVDERRELFGDDAKSDADVLLMKALDKEGQKLFTIEDKPFLKTGVDSAVVLRVASHILRGVNRSADQIAKN